MQIFGRLSAVLCTLVCAALIAGCAVESYPGLSTSNDLDTRVLSSDEQKAMIRDLTAAQDNLQVPENTEEKKTP